MNNEDASNMIVQSLIDLLNMVKGLKNENQQPSVTQELGRLFPRTRDGGRTGESRQLLSVDAGESATDTNNTSFTTQSITKRIFEEI